MADRQRWIPAADEPKHPLAQLEGVPLAGCMLAVRLGPKSRFGARYFTLHLRREGAESEQAVLSGLHHSGHLPSYNWIEVAETRTQLSFAGGRAVDVPEADLDRLFALLLGLIPTGGHLMVEYDSAERAETAQALAHSVPPIASPLGSMLFRLGCGAYFKDWQIAEGGSEGPRKLQAYKPLTPADAARWRQRAASELEAFLRRPETPSPLERAARQRAAELLPLLRAV